MRSPILAIFLAMPALAQPTDVKPGSITYEEVEYPHPVKYFPLTMYGQDVRMAFMSPHCARGSPSANSMTSLARAIGSVACRPGCGWMRAPSPARDSTR